MLITSRDKEKGRRLAPGKRSVSRNFSRHPWAWALWLVMVFSPLAWAENSGTVTVSPSMPAVAPIQLSNWSVRSANASAIVSSQTAPDGAPVVEFTMTVRGPLEVQYNFADLVDLRNYDAFVFWVQGTVSVVGDFVFLVDRFGNRRWYSFNIESERGWQQPHYFINSFIGQDPYFDLSRIIGIRFAQVSEPAGAKVLLSNVKFENNAVNHADAPSMWLIDLGQGTLQSSSDAVSGTSILARITATSWGQADIATGTVLTGITWNFSQKTYLSFYYKDSTTNAAHYCLIYDKYGCYREWIFDNSPLAGKWAKIVVELRDNAYATVCPPGRTTLDLSNIVYFETGVFSGTPGATYTFQVDEVSVN